MVFCRLTAYKGKSLLLGDLIVKPKNSLVCQSRDAWFHPGVVDEEHIRNIRVNGDGFGCAFYGANVEQGSCVIKFVTPAWSNKNLINLGNYVYSNLIMAHVRAATNGKDPFEQCAVSIENCHPFKYGRWTFMHNGGIPRFHKVKRAMLNELSDEVFQVVTGSTDSEHIFALFLHFLPDRNGRNSIDEATIAIEKTISKVLELCQQCGVTEPCSLNLVFTDGMHIYATRFRNGADSPPSLYYNYGKDFNCETGCFEIHDKSEACEIVVSSAPLTKGCTNDGKCGNWTLMPDNNLLVCVGDECEISRVSKIYLKPIDIIPTCSDLTMLKCQGLSKQNSLPKMVFDNSKLDLASFAASLESRCMSPPSNDTTRRRTNSNAESVGLPLDASLNPPTWSEEMFTSVPYTGEQIPSSIEKKPKENSSKESSSKDAVEALSPVTNTFSLKKPSFGSFSGSTSKSPEVSQKVAFETVPFSTEGTASGSCRLTSSLTLCSRAKATCSQIASGPTTCSVEKEDEQKHRLFSVSLAISIGIVILGLYMRV